MDQSRQTLRLRLLGVALIIVALFNLASNFGIFGQPEPGDTRTAIEGEVDQEEILEAIGAINRVTGIPTFLTALVMVAAGIGLLAIQPWAITAGLITLGLDIVLKIINIVSEIIVGTPLVALVLVFILLVIEGVLFYFLLRQRRNASTAQTHTSPMGES